MKLTAELRFWWTASIPEIVREWFMNGRRNLPLEARSDIYLHPSQAGLGIKIRGDTDRLEIKTLVKDDVPVTGTLNGQLWVKAVSGLTISTHVGIRIAKRRFLRSFSAEGREIPERRPSDGRSNQGCDDFEVACTIELAEVSGEELPIPWWSLGFEASGNFDVAPMTLAKIFCDTQADSLPLVDVICESYPQWLLRLQAQ